MPYDRSIWMLIKSINSRMPYDRSIWMPYDRSNLLFKGSLYIYKKGDLWIHFAFFRHDKIFTSEKGHLGE